MHIIFSFLVILVSVTYNYVSPVLFTLNYWFLLVYNQSKKKYITQIFLVFFFFFHLLPLNYVLFKNNFLLVNETVSTGRLVSDTPYALLLLLLLFLVSFYYTPNIKFPEVKQKIRFIHKPKNIDLILLFILFLLAFLGKYYVISEVLNKGYLEFHLGKGIVKRSPIFFFIEIFFLIQASITFSKYKRITNVLLVTYSVLILLTGMRLPFVLMTLTLYLLNFKIERNYIFKLSYVFFGFVFFILFFGYTQLFRNSISLDIFSLNTFIDFAFQAQIKSLSSTNDLLSLSIYNDITGFKLNPFYYLYDIYDQLNSKIDGTVLSMNDRIKNGNLGYYIFSLYEPNLFKLGRTGGGTFFGEIYLFYGFFGIVIISFLLKYFLQYFDLILMRKRPKDYFILIFFFPYFARLFRDNYFNILFWYFISIVLWFSYNLFKRIFLNLFIVIK